MSNRADLVLVRFSLVQPKPAGSVWFGKPCREPSLGIPCHIAFFLLTKANYQAIKPSSFLSKKRVKFQMNPFLFVICVLFLPRLTPCPSSALLSQAPAPFSGLSHPSLSSLLNVPMPLPLPPSQPSFLLSSFASLL